MTRFLKMFFLLPGMLFFPLEQISGKDVYTLEYSGNRNTLFRNGELLTFAGCVEEVLKHHADYSARDMAELAFHGAFGAGFVSFDRIQQRQMIIDDLASIKASDVPLFEIISPNYCRISLAAWKFHKLPGDWLFNIYCASAEVFPDSGTLYSDYIDIIAGKKPEFSNKLKSAAQSCKAANNPAYRVVSNRYLQVIPVLQMMAQFPEETVCVIAVDGRAASGKTTLSRQLAFITGGGVIHMDDFFLPVEMRTPERLNQPGGNVHYERFKAEVLPKLRSAKAFEYQRFDCSKMELGKMRSVTASRWRIVEGAYSFHPEFGKYADLKVFFDISPAEQIKRIVRRNGERAAAVFSSRWIPLEENYIRSFNIKQKSDIVIGNCN